MELYEELNEIKKNPDFPKFVEIFNLVKSEYDKDKNKDISEYINLT
jgi:alanyl-tRNA synthetase